MENKNQIATVKQDIGCNFLVVSALAKSKSDRFKVTYLVHMRERETVLRPSSSPTIRIYEGEAGDTYGQRPGVRISLQ